MESFPREKQGMAMAVYGMGVVVAPGHRPHPRRLDHRQLQLALDLPHQYSGGHPVAGADLLPGSRSAVPGAQESRQGFKIDYMGFGLLALGLGSLEVVLDEGQRKTGSPRISS